MVKMDFHNKLISDNQLLKTLYEFGWSLSYVLIKCIVHGSSVVETGHFGQGLYCKRLVFLCF